MGNHRLTVARAKFGKLSSSRKEKRSLVSVVASLLMLVGRWRFSFLPPVHYPSKKKEVGKEELKAQIARIFYVLVLIVLYQYTFVLVTLLLFIYTYV